MMRMRMLFVSLALFSVNSLAFNLHCAKMPVHNRVGCLARKHPMACGPRMTLAEKADVPQSGSLYRPVIQYKSIEIETTKGISIWDITPQIRQLLLDAEIENGFVNVISRHTTTALIINEYESRLMDDVRQFLIKLAPPGEPYLHNDLHVRPLTEEDKRRVISNGWDISNPATLQAWRDQEPFNAHSHLLSMLLGNSESIPVHQGKLVIGQWQSVMLVDLDGPRKRTVGVQVVGM